MTHLQYEDLSQTAVAAASVVYALAAMSTIAYWGAGRKDAPDGGRLALIARIGVALTVLAASLHFLGLLTRGLAADPVRVPWGNMYEFTLSASWVVVVGYLILLRLYSGGRYAIGWMAPIVLWFTLVVLMLDVLVLYEPVTPLRDALQSYWLVIHVVAAVIATGAFSLGGMFSIVYLVLYRHRGGEAGEAQLTAAAESAPESDQQRIRLPELKTLDRLSFRMHAFAFPVWTFGALIAGPIWAHAAWGRAWGWDPKEVWAFITWVVYAGYLHARLTAGWKGKAAAIVAIVGLLTLLFNFVGVNYFFGAGTLHSYA